MSRAHWVPITAIENLPLKEGRSLHWQGLDIAIFNPGTHVVAVENKCPPQDGRLVDPATLDFIGAALGDLLDEIALIAARAPRG